MEEDTQKNHIDSILVLHESEKLNSNELTEKFNLTFTNEDDKNFKIWADGGENQFISRFKISDYISKKEKDFTNKIYNFKLLLKFIEKALEKKRIILTKISDSLKLTFHYENIIDEKLISFELTKMSSGKKEDIYEDKKKNESLYKEEYIAEIIEYNNKFEEYEDNKIIRVIIENKGNHYWNKGKTSFKCAQELSSLLCREYILKEYVMPGEQIEIILEFPKNQKVNMKNHYVTSLYLNENQHNYEPILRIDLSEALNKETNNFKGDEKKENDEKTKELNEKNIEKKDTESNKEHFVQQRINYLNAKEKERIEEEKLRNSQKSWKKNIK